MTAAFSADAHLLTRRQYAIKPTIFPTCLRDEMPDAKNTKLISHIDCPGGGQVWVDGKTLYIGHMQAPTGTTIVDISDPQIAENAGAHRAAAGLALAQGARRQRHHDRQSRSARQRRPPRLSRRTCDLRREESGRAEVDRQVGDRRHRRPSLRFRRALRLCVVNHERLCRQHRRDPRPCQPGEAAEVSNWWIPGQWKDGGEEYPWADFVEPRCHHPLRVGDRLNVSYWHHGMYILDISDLSKPKMVSGHRRSPAFPHPTHTCLAIPTPAEGPQGHGGRRRGRDGAAARRRQRLPGSTTSPTSDCRFRSPPST